LAFLELEQVRKQLEGVGSFNSFAFGPFAYDIEGRVWEGGQVELQLEPRKERDGVGLGRVSATAVFHSATQRLVGEWRSTLGTRGVFEVQKQVTTEGVDRRLSTQDGLQV
jgi:hypothetical protein